MNRNLLLLLLLLMSCGTQKVTPVEIARDSVSVVVKESVIYKDSIVFIDVPAEVDRAILWDSDTSFLETSVAESQAWVEEGQLNHILKNKPDLRIPKIVTLPIYLKSKETEHLAKDVITQKVEVEKELNKWQIFRMMVGTLTIIVIGINLLIRILKKVKP